MPDGRRMDDLSAKFLPQFLSLARARLARAIAAATARDHAAGPTIVAELHTLAGEAGLLGLRDVVPLARDGEQKAKALHASRSAADADALIDTLHRLERIIENIAAAREAKK
jgi:HPt (histidine-containing phosphotransfer) domain-containing protein